MWIYSFEESRLINIGNARLCCVDFADYKGKHCVTAYLANDYEIILSRRDTEEEAKKDIDLIATSIATGKRLVILD